jgi:hypothetical protein
VPACTPPSPRSTRTRGRADVPITLGGTAAVLVAVGLFAGSLPVRGVSRLDPTTALRE